MCSSDLANAFLKTLRLKNQLAATKRIQIELYGSLALTGRGHGTDKAILNGLEGKEPETVHPESMIPRMESIFKTKQLELGGEQTIAFHSETDLLFYQKKCLPMHTNGMRFMAFDAHNHPLSQNVYYSIGGGFICTENEYNHPPDEKQSLPYLFTNAKTLLAYCHEQRCSIADLMFKNEQTWRSADTIHQGIKNIASVMNHCIDSGCQHESILTIRLNI